MPSSPLLGGRQGRAATARNEARLALPTPDLTVSPSTVLAAIGPPSLAVSPSRRLAVSPSRQLSRPSSLVVGERLVTLVTPVHARTRTDRARGEATEPVAVGITALVLSVRRLGRDLGICWSPLLAVSTFTYHLPRAEDTSCPFTIASPSPRRPLDLLSWCYRLFQHASASTGPSVTTSTRWTGLQPIHYQ